MSKNRYHSPHSPHSLAQDLGRLGSTHSPRPICNMGGRVSACALGANQSNNEEPGGWIPQEYRLPDTIEEIEAGRPPKQRDMFEAERDESREGRLAHILSTVPGIVTGARLENQR